MIKQKRKQPDRGGGFGESCQGGGYNDFLAIEMGGTEVGSEGIKQGINSRVVSDTGCPVGRLYRECQPGEGCPFSCAHIMEQVACFSDSCEEGCHCPEGTFQHHLACVQVRTQLAKSPSPCPPLFLTSGS